jgi:molybdate transport system substrate-binding protein
VKRKFNRISSIAAAVFAVNICLIVPFANEAAAQSTELRVFSSDGMKPAMEKLLPQIESSIGRRLTTQFDASKRLKQKIQSGEGFDVAILTSDAIDDLIAQGKIAAATRVDVARCGIGVGIRPGQPKPDIRSPEALKQALLKAKSITFDHDGASAVYVNEMLVRLGIAEEVRPKLILEQAPGRPQMNVAEGKAELVFTLIPEISGFRGVELVGPLPADLQSYVNFAAGVATNTHDPEAAKAAIKFITSPAAAPALKATGMEPR